MPEVRTDQAWVRMATAEDMESLGVSLSKRVQPGDWILLSGPLGAGKSVLARSLIRWLGATEWQGSPTYTLVNEYHTDPPIFHVDLYRLSAPDLAELGFEDRYDSRAITIVEWADRGGEELRRLCGARAWFVDLVYVGMTERDVRITAPTTESSS